MRWLFVERKSKISGLSGNLALVSTEMEPGLQKKSELVITRTPATAVGAVTMSWLQTLGKDVKSVFNWLGSPKVQGAITTGEVLGETVVDAFNPALAGLNPIINSWTQEIFKAQALGAAADATTGSGAAKAAMVLQSVTPQVVAFAEQNKLPVPTGTQLQAANDALVEFLDVLGGASSDSVTPVPASTPAQVQIPSSAISS